MENQNKEKSGDEEEASCCIPQESAIKVIGMLSCGFGVVISTLTSILTLAIGKNGNDDASEFIISCTPVNWLLIVGMMQTVTSVLLLVAKEKRKIMKIWTISHIMTAITTVVYLWSLLVSSYAWDYWTKIFFSFVGVNFCIMIFMTLVMIEFLLHPAGENYKTREHEDFNL